MALLLTYSLSGPLFLNVSRRMSYFENILHGTAYPPLNTPVQYMSLKFVHKGSYIHYVGMFEPIADGLVHLKDSNKERTSSTFVLIVLNFS